MKCPKCSYLGFETGDRCRNCGYDFSLAAVEPPAPDLALRGDDAPDVAPDLGLPLFVPEAGDDAPLISLPAAPRPPLAVRRTPEAPRVRTVPRAVRTPEHPGPVLDFQPDSQRALNALAMRLRESAPRPPTAGGQEPPATGVGGRRLAAAAIDHVILVAVDAAIVYFTLRMAGLTSAEASLLPLAPLVTFVLMLKLAYFASFTAVGGQTIGKMAVGIRVVGDGEPVDAAMALRRTLASALSLLPLGAGFLPAFFGTDRRALHDRLTHTRVVGLPSA